MVNQLVLSRNPWRAASGPIADADGDPRSSAVLDLGVMLRAGAGLTDGAIREVLGELNRRNCSPRFTDEELDVLHATIVETPAVGSPENAVHAYLYTMLEGVRFFSSNYSVRFTWKGRLVDHIRPELTHVQKDLLSARVCGDLGVWARSIHPKATGAMILARLREMALNAAEPEDEEARAERFVQACLHGQFSTIVDGERVRVTLHSSPGAYHGAGLALVERNSRWLLLVNLETVFAEALRDHPDFGRGRLSVHHAARLLRSHADHDPRVRVANFRARRWHGVWMPDDYLPAGHEEDEGTDGTETCSAASPG